MALHLYFLFLLSLLFSSISTPAHGQSPTHSPSSSPTPFCGVRVLANTTGLEFVGYLSYENRFFYYPHLHPLRTHLLNHIFTSFTIKLKSNATLVWAELRYNDNVPSGFNDGSTGKPGELVPNGDQFNPVPRDNGDGTYTFFTTARPGLVLSSNSVFWLVLSFTSATAFGWTVGSTDDITLERSYYNNGQYEVLGGRTAMLKLHGCANLQPFPSFSPSPSHSPTASPTPSFTPSPTPTPSPSNTPSSTPSPSSFALPVAIASGRTFTNGRPSGDPVVSMSTSETTTSTQCAGNIIVGLSGTGIRFSYFVRLTGAASATTNARAYIVDMSTATVLGQVDVSVRMPTAAKDSYTRVTASITLSSSLKPLLSYWLPFCVTNTTTANVGEASSIDLGGVDSSAKATVGWCSSGPSCKPTVLAGTMATEISSSSAGSGGDSDTVAIAAGVAIPVGLAGVMVCVVAYIAYKRSRGRLAHLLPARRRSSAGDYKLLDEPLTWP